MKAVNMRRRPSRGDGARLSNRFHSKNDVVITLQFLCHSAGRASRTSFRLSGLCFEGEGCSYSFAFRGWQAGQTKDRVAPVLIFMMVVPHREQGSPSRYPVWGAPYPPGRS